MLDIHKEDKILARVIPVDLSFAWKMVHLLSPALSVSELVVLEVTNLVFTPMYLAI